MTKDQKMLDMDELMRLTPEEARRIKAFYVDEQPRLYASILPLPEEARERLRVVYLGFSVPEEEAIKSARRYFAEHCSGVRKE